MAAPSSNRTKFQQIIAAAEAIFADAGFKGTSISAVARSAGVSKANVFHHFGNKEELYLAVLRNAHHRLIDDLETVGMDGESSFEERINRVADRYLNHLFEHAHLARLFMRELLDESPVEGKVLAQHIFQSTFSEVVALLDEGRENQELRQDIKPAAPTMLLIAGCIFYFQYHEVFRHFPEVTFADDREEYVRTLASILTKGMISK